MPLADWNDVLRARKAADDAAPKPLEINLDDDDALLGTLFGIAESLRLEMRALGVAISYAFDEGIRGR